MRRMPDRPAGVAAMLFLFSALMFTASCGDDNSTKAGDTTPEIVKYGFYEEFSETSGHSANYLLGSKITVTEASTLTHLCLIAKTAGPQVKIGLYSDEGGEPELLIVSTPATVLVDGELEIAVTETALPAGDYWFMAVYSTMANIGYNTTNPEAVFKYIDHVFATALPAAFPAPETATEQEFNYYIKTTVP